ncbi:MAG: hypothetical protein GY891_07405 [Bacteroidetes bacterium]|nr:hypothetical protein [Bacteroidota bacterium]
MMRNTDNLVQMPNTRYTEGYLPKIAYHMFKNNYGKMLYFYDRQIEKYGEMTNAQKERVTELHNELIMDQAVQEAQDHFMLHNELIMDQAVQEAQDHFITDFSLPV